MSHEDNADDIAQAYNDLGYDIDEEEVAGDLEDMAGMSVPENQRISAATNKAGKRVEASEAERSQAKSTIFSDGDSEEEREPTPVAELDQLGEHETDDEIWTDARVMIVDLWEPNSDAVAQVGLAGDESGTVKFIVFSSSKEEANLQDLEEGESYALDSVITEYYEPNDQWSIKLTKEVGITELDEEIEVPDNEMADDEVEFTGAVVSAGDNDNSDIGLIKRCTEEDCTRVLQNGRCRDHGQVDGEYDMRVKAVIDDGLANRNIVINDEEDIEALLADDEDVPSSIEDAQELAEEMLDRTIVGDRVEEALIGRTLNVSAVQMDHYLVVNDVEQVTDVPDVDSGLIEARSLQEA